MADTAFAAAGSANGAMLLSECLREGAEKATEAVSDLGFKAKAPHDAEMPRRSLYASTPLWWVKEIDGKAFVDYQNDVTAKDLPLAAREGYSSIELAKRYTTAGMATDQGKLGNVNAIAILAEAAGKSMDRDRHHDFPALLHAGAFRRLRRALYRPSFPAGAQDALA